MSGYPGFCNLDIIIIPSQHGFVPFRHDLGMPIFMSRMLESGFLSGFPKSIYLDRICLGSGFVLNQSFSDIFLNLSLVLIQNYQKLSFSKSRILPGCHNPDFGFPVRPVSKKVFIWTQHVMGSPNAIIFQDLWSSIACSGLFSLYNTERVKRNHSYFYIT